MANTPLASLLPGVCSDLTSRVDLPSTSLSRMDTAVEEQLVSVDEASALLDTVRLETSHTTDTSYTTLRSATAGSITALFHAIDALDAHVASLATVAARCSDRCDDLHRGYDSRFPEGMARLTSWLGGVKRASHDAPVALPTWTDTRATVAAFHAVNVVEAVRGAIGDAAPVAGQQAVDAGDGVYGANVEGAAAVDASETVAVAAPVAVSRGEAEDEEEEED